MMIVIWQVDDGYVTGSRPQKTEIPDDEIDECETEQEKQLLIHDYIQNDFEQYISWYIK